MSENRTSLEIIAPSIEEAVEKGLADLGLSEDAVEIEVLDEGSRGLFGLGSRQARVRLTIRSAKGGAAPRKGSLAKADQVAVEAPKPAEIEVQELIEVDLAVEEESDEGEEEPETRLPSLEEEIALDIARETVIDLLDRMRIRDVEVTSRYVDADDSHGRSTLWVDIEGDDLAILIGPQAENLTALQYIASLIVGKELGRSLHMTVDVQGYRQRRANSVRKLARRMADQAIKTGKRQFLEPMPANERRLIHIELRNHPQVITESVGEEPRRKVTIVPKSS